MTGKTTGFIAGQWQISNSSVECDRVLDPARAVVIEEIAVTPAETVDMAVAAAAEAFAGGEWRRTPSLQRGTILLEISRRIREHANELAQLESRNAGKPIGQARGEVLGAAEVFDYYGRMTVMSLDDLVAHDASQFSLAIREPIGVVAAIVPWNYPLVVASQAIAPALAVGCSVVLKPSELTPLTAISLVRLLDGLLPAGVVNLVQGGGTVGAQLAAHPDVNAVLFTGSTAVGQEILRGAAGTLKRVTLELGGKAPVLIFEDAPFDAAVSNALARVVTNQGENCGAGTRLLVHQKIHDRFVKELLDAASNVTIGDPQDENVALGPMISPDHHQKVLSYVERVPEGEVMFRGPVPTAEPFSRGFYAPLVLTSSGPGTPIWRDEIFGPILTIVPFANESEAIMLANDTDYGLFASLWSGDRGHALRVARELRAGVVRINNGVEPIQAPWGGMRLSGLGRTSGRWSLECVTEVKTISLGIA